MKKTIREMRPVYVVGIGLHKYQHMSDTTFVTLGLTAVRAGLARRGNRIPRRRLGLHGDRANRNGGVAPDFASPRRERNSDGAG